MAFILIVEDDDSVRAFTARALASDGHAVETASDGEGGLERIRVHGHALDLVLSDIRMPVMDGIEMARAARRDYPRLPVMLMTGYADQRERAAELDGLILGVIDKPFSLAELRSRVSAVLRPPADAGVSRLAG